MSVLPDLTRNPRALRAVKRPVPVRVRFATADGICETLEGAVAFHSGDAILTGVAGESWPVERIKFDERYLPAEGTLFGADGEYMKRPMTVLALRLDTPLEIQMPAGGSLRGDSGDWLLQYAASDYGIVKDEIFQATYDIQQAVAHR